MLKVKLKIMKIISGVMKNLNQFKMKLKTVMQKVSQKTILKKARQKTILTKMN